MRKVGDITYGEAHGDLGQNRGVVCYEKESQMNDAAKELDGREINGKDITVTAKVSIWAINTFC
jgi:hypothetical protein